MIFRRTDVFKKVTPIETQITPQLTEKNLGKMLEIKKALHFTGKLLTG